MQQIAGDTMLPMPAEGSPTITQDGQVPAPNHKNLGGITHADFSNLHGTKVSRANKTLSYAKAVGTGQQVNPIIPPSTETIA